MSTVQYPFVDIAVHPDVRVHFAAGRALVLFSRDMQDVLWANGRGAALFGVTSVYDFLDQPVPSQDLTFRQASAAARQLMKPGDRRGFNIRITSGFQRVLVEAVCQLITLSDETQGVLLSIPVSAGALDPSDCARQMLEGLDDPSTHMAVLDSEGTLVSSSAEFAKLQLDSHLTQALATTAVKGGSRLLKRPVTTAFGDLPAAIAKVSDDPVLLLLFIVQVEAPGTAQETLPAVAEEAPAKPEATRAIDFEEALTAVSEISDLEDDMEFEDTEESRTPETQKDASTESATKTETIAKDEATPEAAHVAAPAQFNFGRENRATRFVWKIDADGRFRDVSPELAAAVGPHAAEVTGMAFTDVAALFNLDPDGKIAELLQKRDTWSGKTIWWPVEGTSLVVPIDLAALPTYTRTREFDGFRGFGIIRFSDAEEDPLAIGLTMTDVQEAPADEPAIEDARQTLAVSALDHADDEGDADIGEHTPAAEAHADSLEPTEQPPEEASAGSVDAPSADAPAPIDHSADVPERFSPPAVEKPALRIVENPTQRFSDKVIQFEELRSNARQPLSPNEQAAFREIARRLDAFAREQADTEAPADRSAPLEEQTAATNPPLTEGKTAPQADAQVEPPQHGETEAPVTSTDDAVAHEVTPASGLDSEQAQQAEQVEPAAEEAAADTHEAAEQEEETFHEALSRIIPLRHRPDLSDDIIDQMPVALLVHTGDRLIHANPEFLRLTGYESVEALEEVGGLDALLKRQDLEDKTTEAGGMAFVRADDEIIPVSARLQSVRWMGASALILALMPTGQTQHATAAEVTASQQEISTQADEIARLKVEVDELKAILDTATDGVVIIDSEGDIRSMNRAASALFNYDDGETRGQPFVMLFAHESQKSVLEYLSGLAGHGVASVLNDGREVMGREASGGFLPLFMTIGKLTSSNGYCAVIRDITQWKRTEEELRNAKRAAETANAHKTDFLAHVSHEIRTPLNAIIGFADMMATERLGPVGHPRYVEYANDIGRSGRHVLDIVNDLLDISKIEAGEMDLEFSSVGLNDTVAEAVSLVQPQANSQRVIIRTALSHSVPPVVADIRSIKQIVLNILSNAIRFTPAGGQIVVSTAYEANGSVVLRIRDTGIGMSRSELELAMKPFRQVAGASRKRGDGTGLGLPLTKAMVDANRASFAIHSTPNEGTLVEVTFPSPRVLAN
ncbi:ATP-binding protein [Rhizobium oryzicola]|uniref:histidine kinase n=1 Tax=Rhizobium oryzicola TaxID=1232668 RepID=A0ABT8SRN6_9HYPH|nr:ATP-binding protein [Rhizobium oryzicola]MDO1581082.1 PAS domain S-box protein [Rhizobium oryzicola]